MHERHWEHPLSVWISFDVPDLEAEKGENVRKERGRGAAFQGVPGGLPGGGTGKTHPPLLVLFSCNYDHLSFDKSQLVVVVGLAVVDGLHPAGFGLPLDTQKSLSNKHVSKASEGAAAVKKHSGGRRSLVASLLSKLGLATSLHPGFCSKANS